MTCSLINKNKGEEKLKVILHECSKCSNLQTEESCNAVCNTGAVVRRSVHEYTYLSGSLASVGNLLSDLFNRMRNEIFECLSISRYKQRNA